MINQRDILKMIKHVSRRSAGKTDKRLIHPVREWVIGLVLFFGLVIAGGIYNAYAYQMFSNIETELKKPEADTIQYQEKAVDQALIRFRTRQADYTALQTTFEPPEPVSATDSASSTSSTTSTTSQPATTATPESGNVSDLQVE